MKKAILLASIFILQMAGFATAADCLPRLTAPGSFLNSPAQWGMDSGPILDGFLELEVKGGAASILHGIDLSHHNDYVDYSELARCGAEFAVVKMDKMFETHRNSLKAANIKVLPYHYLSVDSTKAKEFTAKPARFSGKSGGELPAADLKALLEIAHARGTAQAQAFVSLYQQRMKDDDVSFDLAGLKGRFMILDVEEHFKDGVKSTAIQRQNFGRFYAAMLSSWVAEVKTSFPDAIIVFYTFPDIFTSYLQFARPEDNVVIHGLPVWLARTRGDGSDFDLDNNKNLQRICLSSAGGNRCILHQYSHRALFGIDADKKNKKTVPPYHIDVDRLFKVKTVNDQVGVQYVRE